jgi:hypothetical protein
MASALRWLLDPRRRFKVALATVFVVVLVTTLFYAIVRTTAPESAPVVTDTTSSSLPDVPDTTLVISTTEGETTEPATTSTVTDEPPTTSTVPGEPTDSDVKECEKRVSANDVKATFADVLPMTVGKSSPVVIILTVGGASPSATGTIPGASVTTTKLFPQFTCEVAAQLRGLNFDIDNPDKITQSFLGTNDLTWSWNVIPKNTSANEVDVDFYPVIRTASGELIPGKVRTATVAIVVKAAKVQSWWHRAGNWVIGILVLSTSALIVAWLRYWFGPGKDDPEGAPLIRRLRARWAGRRRGST